MAKRLEMKIFTAEQMRAFDREAVETYKIPSIVLMENAALRVVEFLEAKFAPLKGKRITVLCGKGNNGGDGFAIARHLSNAEADVQALAISVDDLKGDAKTNLEITQAMFEAALVAFGGAFSRRGFGTIETKFNRSDAASCDIVVDALLGTGFSGEVRPEFEDALGFLHSARSSGASVVAVDLPSGLNAENGQAAPRCCRAKYTVTFAAPKRGFFVRDGAEKCGEIWVGDIGAATEQMEDVITGVQMMSRAGASFFKPRRSRDAHKGDAGRVMVIGGSRGMSGAVAMASHAALQVGAGLCSACVPDAILDTVAASVLEAVTHPLPCDKRGALTEDALEELRSQWENMQVVALGPGTGRSASTWELVRAIVRECPVPLIIDADALHALPEIADEVKSRQSATILTPHPGEMGVLLGKKTSEIQDDRFGAVEECGLKYNAFTVLKGAYSLIYAPQGLRYTSLSNIHTWVNPTGNAGMATGGSGDVLTGTIAGLLAQQPKRTLGAVLFGVYLHGLAGDLAFEKHGNGLTARDISAHLGAALLELDKPRGEEINGRLRRLI